MASLFDTIAEQLLLVLSDQLGEARFLVGLALGQIGAVPRCSRCGELVHDPQPVIAGRCWPCESVVDGAADGRVEG